MATNREELVIRARTKRVPVFESNRNKITVSGLDQENFMYRWVNDVNDRIGMFLTGGWSFVDEKGHQVGDEREGHNPPSGALNRNMGRGVTAYLMRIPLELWNEDQAKKAQDEIQISNKRVKDTASQGADYGKVTVEIKGHS